MLEEPHQGLPGAAEFHHLVERQGDGFLYTAVGILLESAPDLHEADGSRDHKLPAPRLLVASGQ